VSARPNRSGYRGYVTCREFGGLKIPVPIQALTMRDYCARKKFLYKLHVNENIFPHSYMVLESLVRNLEGLEGLLVTSVFMLPERPDRRRAIYEHIYRQDVTLHFVMEDMVLARPGDEAAAEEILAVYHTLKKCPAFVPGEAGVSVTS
jgi:sporadic carbohydrate cluster protein (TIGR04323 family)